MARVIIAAAFFTVAVAVGTTEVVCNDTSVDWSFNQENVSPCQVAANLGAICSATGDYDISALDPAFGNFYTPSPLATACECSSVVYSLAATCGLCQGATFTNWLHWSTNCTAVSPGFFPFTLPPNTSVPHWAYLDVTASNLFSPSAAQQAGDTPESSSVGSPSSTSATPPSGSTSGSPHGSSSHSSHTGAIAGGVVGGVVGVALLGALIFFLVRRSKNNRPILGPSQPYDDKQYIASPGPFNDNYAHALVTTPFLEAPGQKPYDPNDPSTFPGANSSVAGSAHQRQSPQSPGFNSQHSHPTPAMPHQPGGYSGVAEV